jgi:putative redox protein
VPDQSPGGASAEETGAGRFQVRIATGGTTLLADEPVVAGGLGSGPTPYELLCAALAACTTMTLRLYAEGKGWPVAAIRTQVGHSREPGKTPPDLFVRRIALPDGLEAEQRARLIAIADRCPVHRTLTGGARIETLASDDAPRCEPDAAHAIDMEALIAVGRGSYDFTQG